MCGHFWARAVPASTASSHFACSWMGELQGAPKGSAELWGAPASSGELGSGPPSLLTLLEGRQG
eukprot:9977306-Alexandrium_andersonii.AAC.1